MADDYQVTLAGTGELTPAVVERCLAILERGGAVDIPSARQELPLAPLVVLARHGETVVGLGAIKRTRENYAVGRATKSGVPFDPKTPEFGYVAVDDDHQGRGLSKKITNLLLEKNTGTLFSTTYNDRMKRVLRQCGFERRGRHWPGVDGDLLTLWIRDSTRRDLATQHQLRGWLDYDREKLPGLTPPERIAYFEWRVRRVAINPLERILATEIEPTAESSALLIFGVSLCCAVEAAGRFLTGGDDFPLQAFLARYMHPDFQQKKLGADTYGDVLRKHFRNGLAHGFAVSHGGFEGAPGQDYFRVRTVAGIDTLEINPTSLFDDFAVGFESYAADLRKAAHGDMLLVAFDRVFTRVFIDGNWR